MDWLNLSAALPVLGPATGLLVLIGIVIRLWTTSETRASREIGRINVSHDAELAELREQLDRCRSYADGLQQRLDDEREKRRAAEDETQRPTTGRPRHPGRQTEG